jgi:hypothetical protein
MTDIQDDPDTASFPLPPEEATAVLWDQGPVDPPPPLPPPDPSYEAVVVEAPGEEAIPEIPADEVEEVLESVDAGEGAGVVGVATVSWVDDDAADGDAVPLDALLVTPPPAHASALAPPLPPPGSNPPPMPHPAVAVAGTDAPPEVDPFAASPSFVTGEHRIVLHTVEGQVLRGSLANADLEDAELPMIQPNGAVARVPAGHVKAIFFMLATGERPPQSVGTRVRITFSDGRQVSGIAPDYSAGSAGFFVLPLDARTNTARVWVYRAAIRQISVG